MYQNRYLVKIARAVTQAHQERVLSKLDQETGIVAAHSMGSGKTLTALLAIEKALKESPKKVLVAVPAPLVSNMKEESEKHKIDISDPRVILLSYEGAVAKASELAKENYSLAVMDEAHRLRNKETKRASELDKVFERADKTLQLTGTPIYNKPHDIAVLVNQAAGKKVLPEDQKAFEARYIGQRKIEPGFFAKTVLGVSTGYQPYLKNTNELKSILKQYVDVYDAKVENPGDFPTTHEKVVRVEMDEHQQKIYNFLEGNLPAPIRWKIRMSNGCGPASRMSPRFSRSKPIRMKRSRSCRTTSNSRNGRPRRSRMGASGRAESSIPAYLLRGCTSLVPVLTMP